MWTNYPEGSQESLYDSDGKEPGCPPCSLCTGAKGNWSFEDNRIV